MELYIERGKSTKNSTPGSMYIMLNGKTPDDQDDFICYTLEPERQPDGAPKIPGHTAIPKGRYKLVKYFSPGHGYTVPLYVNVPNFDKVEIHIGNFMYGPNDGQGKVKGKRDSTACTLVGNACHNDVVVDSGTAFHDLMNNYLLPAWARNEEVWMTITDEE